MSTDERSGKQLGRLDTVRQAVARVVRTPLHTRPMTPMFGTDHMSLAALPMNAVGTARLAGHVAKAIATWEPRASVERTRFDGDMHGRVSAAVTARADGVAFEVDLRASETLSEMRLRPAYLWEPGDDWTPTLGDAGAIAVDGGGRVFDGLVQAVEITGLDFGYGVAWTVMVEATGDPVDDLLGVDGAVVFGAAADTTATGVVDPWKFNDDYEGPDEPYLSGFDVYPPAHVFLSHDGAGRVTTAIGEVSATRVADAPLPAATTLVIGPNPMTVHRLAYWRRELTARERAAVFRELQRAQ